MVRRYKSLTTKEILNLPEERKSSIQVILDKLGIFSKLEDNILNAQCPFEIEVKTADPDYEAKDKILKFMGYTAHPMRAHTCKYFLINTGPAVYTNGGKSDLDDLLTKYQPAIKAK